MPLSTCISLIKKPSNNSNYPLPPLQINESGAHGTPAFPVAIYNDDVTENYVNWHWHEEFETGFVLEGSILIECGNGKYVLSKGDIFFINSNVLHSMSNNAPPHTALFKSITFHGSVVGGNEGSVFYNKYLLPVLSNSNLRDFVITENDNYHQEILTMLTNIWDAVCFETPDYELIVRGELSNLFRILVHLPESTIPLSPESNYLQESRVQTLPDYMHAHYADKLTLENLSEAASISKSEVLRCFKAVIGQSPIQYLKNYRLQTAACMMRNTNYSISAICELCGFEDNSYFSKSFKELFHCTPREYKSRSDPN
ncbi:MAG: AraC family transcriptional regulator [Roseburia sp.]|nr:AraC family transcriptional regulator [Roseburia sp.]